MAIEGYQGTLEDELYRSDEARWGTEIAKRRAEERAAYAKMWKAEGDKRAEKIRARWKSYGWGS